jgi:hypothetical protein
MNRRPVRTRPWLASFIIALFFMAVAASAAVGWWYARESPAHQGPIVLVSIDGIPATDLRVYGAERSDTPALDELALDSVIFDRAYAHSPQTLPSHVSMLTGQLPLEHGVRDEAGFAMNARAKTLAALLRNRGFTTGAAVSSFLLRPQSGVAQGFSFFDADLPVPTAGEAPPLARQGALTIDAAEHWLQLQGSQRFFLFLQVDRTDADSAIARIAAALKERRLYNDATIIIAGDHGETGAGTSLDDTALRVPLIVKQPRSGGAGRRVLTPVQHIDLVPTILDLVRAPVPGELRGRSLRARPRQRARHDSVPADLRRVVCGVLPFWRSPTLRVDRRALSLRARRGRRPRGARAVGRRNRRRVDRSGASPNDAG